jgi:hypothetical protein
MKGEPGNRLDSSFRGLGLTSVKTLSGVYCASEATRRPTLTQRPRSAQLLDSGWLALGVLPYLGRPLPWLRLTPRRNLAHYRAAMARQRHGCTGGNAGPLCRRRRRHAERLSATSRSAAQCVSGCLIWCTLTASAQPRWTRPSLLLKPCNKSPTSLSCTLSVPPWNWSLFCCSRSGCG